MEERDDQMKTATRPDDLAILGNLLQASLQSKLSETVPVQVRCWLQKQTFMILTQHPQDVVINPQQTFSCLEQIILNEHPSVGPDVKLYLRIAGQKQPYAFHSFTVQPQTPTTTPPTPAADVPNTADLLENSTHSEETEFISHPNTEETAATLPHPWDQPIPEDIPLSEQPQETLIEEKSPSKQSMLPLIVAGTGLSVLIFFGTLYALSRPCVIGSCQVIPEAQALNQKSTNTLQKPQSGKDVLEAQQQLTEAIHLLEAIPMWSSQHGKAQELIKSYQAQAEQVNKMVSALQTAARASYKSDNPPHAPSYWMEVQTMWRDAIAQLEQLPKDSNLQPLAQEKITAYKSNLAQTNQRLLKERQAQGYLQNAKDAALIAEARQGVAQSLEHWQLVYTTWQTAMNRLKQIPQGTTAYQEAQQLTAQYLPKMATARDRRTREQIAANAYNQGLRLAQLAKESQVSDQWSTALTQWRNALTFVNQVPSDTFYYGKAQSLIGTYTKSLKQAQAQLQLAMKLQQARRDLNQTCYGKTKVCLYTIENNVIKIRLTPAYIQMVRQTAIAARTQGDPNVQTGVVNHILTLGEALEAISDNSRIPIEVYAPDGNLIQTHSPGT